MVRRLAHGGERATEGSLSIFIMVENIVYKLLKIALSIAYKL